MKSLPREYPELKNVTVLGDNAFIELEFEEKNVITNLADTNNGKSEFTGWGWVIKFGTELSKTYPEIKEMSKVRLHGIDMNQFIDVSQTNVPHYVPNPEYPAFTFLDKAAYSSKLLSDHPTIFVRNASYFIIGIDNNES
jgi:hypothetical protein